jgi:hypothetical protein
VGSVRKREATHGLLELSGNKQKGFLFASGKGGTESLRGNNVLRKCFRVADCK